MPATKDGMPYIDPNVQFVSVSKLRTLNATNLHDLDKTLVIQSEDQPLAVIVRYEQFLEMQNERERVRTTLEMLINNEEFTALLAGMQDVLSKKTKPLSAVRAEARRRKISR
jgi:hypothetical protein